MFYNEFCELIGRIETLEQGKSGAKALPEKCYFLDRDTILCYPRGTGDSRYPYGTGGYTLWAHSSGNLSLNESTFYVVQPALEGKEPYIAFFGGVKNGDKYTPVSVTGAARQPVEDVRRYTVFTPKSVYYIARTRGADFCLRCYNGSDADKETVFSLLAVNRGGQAADMYLSGFFNCLLMYSPYDSNETKWFKSCKVHVDRFVFHSVVDIDRRTHVNNSALLQVNAQEGAELCTTTARADYVGGMSANLNCAAPLFTGAFAQGRPACNFTDTAVAGSLLKFRLGGGESYRADLVLKVFAGEGPEAAERAPRAAGFAETDARIADASRRAVEKYGAEGVMDMHFGQSLDGMVDGELLSDFLHNVQRQVWYCALAKNSGVSLLGIRDVFQQLEACLIWDPQACRAKIIEALSFTNVDGRLPRQYSLPPREGAVPQMDLRAFIDQGVWVINTVYQYLCYTDDYSILFESCGYLDFTDGTVKLTDERGTVLEHLLKIAGYLIDHIDREKTGCLRIMYGDWNDALDGLGTTEDAGKEYGSGVSVMASLQLYANLREMSEILAKTGGHDDAIAHYAQTREQLREGLQKYAVVAKDGKRRILHGWGDKYGYQVGGFCDVDGKERDGLVVNAYWIIGGAIEWDRSLKRDILESYRRLDSKYGLKTFEPYFEKDVRGVGRIVNLPEGTAENAATYIHATTFGIWSLFMVNESRAAFEQICKILPITHEKLSTTPFVMPNSYVYNEEFGMDGESMSDWFTGSANVLIKTFVRFVFGLQPSLDGIVVQPASYIPFRECSIHVRVKNCVITLQYRKDGRGRRFLVDGVEQAPEDDGFYAAKIVLPAAVKERSKLLLSVFD